jgi:hypothetical protein
MRLAISLTGTMCQIMPRGSIPPTNIPPSLYEYTFDRSGRGKYREPFEHEDRLVIFRQTIDSFPSFDITSVDVVSLASQKMISSVEMLMHCFDLNIGNSYSIQETITPSVSQQDEPYCIIDDSLESIKIKMQFLPKGSIFILVDRFEVDSQGYKYYITKLYHQDRYIGRSLNLSQCIPLFKSIASFQKYLKNDLHSFCEEYHVHPDSFQYLHIDDFQNFRTYPNQDVERR